jgi:pyruvate-formate lyase
MMFPLINVQKSLKYVLEEVYNLNRFPSSHPMMKDALEFDGTMKMVREEVGCFGLYIISNCNLISSVLDIS